MTKTLTIGRMYAVMTSGTCDVTDASGTLITTATAGQQAFFVAPTTSVSFSDNSATVVAVFRPAPAKLKTLGVFGRGESSGYIPVYFLESAAKQYIETGVSPTENTSVLLTAQADTQNGPRWLFSNANANREEVNKMFQMTTTTSAAGNGQTVFGIGTLSSSMTFEGTVSSAVNLYGLQNGMLQYTAAIQQSFTKVAAFADAPTVTIFRHRRDTTAAQIRIWWCKFAEAGVPAREFVPMLDKAGRPCMYDKVTREPYYNANTTTADFTVGMTVAQARRLGSLPSGGGSLTVSVPAAIVDGETVLDAAVQAALDAAAAKGWTITIQTYTEA